MLKEIIEDERYLFYPYLLLASCGSESDYELLFANKAFRGVLDNL